MKRIILIGLMLLLGLSSAEANQVSSMKGENVIILITKKSPPHTGNTPRTPSNVRITAEYDDVACIVYAYLQNAGSLVDITIENQSTGSTTSNLVSGNGTAMIPISGCSGTWVITFVLLNGDEYEGEFVL